jgi:hypothetical protein
VADFASVIQLRGRGGVWLNSAGGDVAGAKKEILTASNHCCVCL